MYPLSKSVGTVYYTKSIFIVCCRPVPPPLAIFPSFQLLSFLCTLLSLFHSFCLLLSFNMVKQLRKRKVISSDDESESSFPQPSQKPASNSIVDSVLRSMFSQPPSTSNYSYLPTKTQPSTSAKASIHQAHAEANKGLKRKSRSTSYRQTFRKEGETEKVSPINPPSPW